MSESTKRCPFCAEEILAAAIKCKHCGSMVPGATPAPAIEGRVYSPSVEPVIMAAPMAPQPPMDAPLLALQSHGVMVTPSVFHVGSSTVQIRNISGVHVSTVAAPWVGEITMGAGLVGMIVGVVIFYTQTHGEVGAVVFGISGICCLFWGLTLMPKSKLSHLWITTNSGQVQALFGVPHEVANSTRSALIHAMSMGR